MSEVHVTRANDYVQDVNSDHDIGIKIDTEKDTAKDNNKIEADSEKNEVDKNVQNDSQLNDSGLIHVAKDADDVNERHGNRNGVSPIPDKRQIEKEKKPKGERSKSGKGEKSKALKGEKSKVLMNEKVDAEEKLDVHTGEKSTSPNMDIVDAKGDKSSTLKEGKCPTAPKREKSAALKADKSAAAQKGDKLNTTKEDKSSSEPKGEKLIAAKEDKSSTALNGDKSTTVKVEKSTNKKKVQKENANGNVKEDCEKKKRKKKKKKKVGSCEDDSTKSGRDGESSLLKVGGGNKANENQMEDRVVQILQDAKSQEKIEESVKEVGENKEDEDNKAEEEGVCGRREEDIIEGCNSEALLTKPVVYEEAVSDDKCEEAVDKDDETQCVENGVDNEDKTCKNVIDVKDGETDNTRTDVKKSDEAEVPEKTDELNTMIGSSDEDILDKDILMDNVDSSENAADLEQKELTNKQDDSNTKSSLDEQEEMDRSDALAVVSFLDTILESDEATVTNVEETVSGTTTDVKDSDSQSSIDNTEINDCIDKDKAETYVDKVDGDGEMDTSTMDNREHSYDTLNAIATMTKEQLQQRLREQHDAMTRLQEHAHTQQVKANLATTSLRAKLRRKDQEMKLVKFEHEQQVSAVISHLLYLEGQMHKDQNDIIEALNERDDVIRRQKAAIEDLAAKNNRYLQALTDSHRHSADNGLVKPQNHVLQQNENISIQDHGNRVILRSNKNKIGEKTQPGGQKVRFSAMKEMLLRRHKSSLELYRHEPLETLMETTMKYGSEENLLVNRNGKPSLVDRKERCRSLIDYPVSLFDVKEGETEGSDNCFSEDFGTPTITRHDSTSSLVTFNEKTAKTNKSQSPLAYGFNELSKSRSVPHGLPTVAENDASPQNLKGRPHSLPSVEMLAKEVIHTASTTASAGSNSNVNSPPSQVSASSSPSPESNPFKAFKSVFKRKGSKKKRAAAVTSGKEQTDALKQHFKKYDMT